ncbi:MAG: hypothetical protein BAJALOKI1v1_330023 [Promethearchaeota archaeon]|nr:MAG: hypothetical protein BAJALOKI1v1_330023 [Candidatus Lokiarchaeota archaeon]
MVSSNLCLGEKWGLNMCLITYSKSILPITSISNVNEVDIGYSDIRYLMKVNIQLFTIIYKSKYYL